MPVSANLPGRFFARIVSAFPILVLALAAAAGTAASIRGVVTDPSGVRITGASVLLLMDGKVIAAGVSTADGSFQITTGTEGRFYLVASGKHFRQLETPGFFAGRLDAVERNLVLEPEWTRESLVLAATGTPTPQPQTSSSTSVLGPSDVALRDSLAGALRPMPGVFVVQAGQRGASASLLLQGGDSTAGKVLLDGVSVGDLGGGFDFGALSSTAIERAEVYRGPDSSLYGADAASGVVNLTTQHGTTSFPSLLFEGDAGNFSTSREQLEVAGARNKLDYLGAFSWLQTANDLPRDEFHVATSAANLGWQPNSQTQLRATVHYGVDATGVPNAWDFYHIADSATRKDQDLFLSASADNQTTPAFHNLLRYGLSRKREQAHLWAKTGAGVFDAAGNSFGDLVTIAGANGHSATGRALLDYAGSYPQQHQRVSNRDEFLYQGDYRVTPHLTALIGFQYEDERGAAPGDFPSLARTSYDYRAAVHGDYKNRFFYTLGGDLGHSSLFGVQTSPRGGFSLNVLRSPHGPFSGTRVLFNYGDALREPSFADQFYSLYNFLEAHGGQSTVQQLRIRPLAPPAARTYEGGVEQAFWAARLVFRTGFFHGEYGRQIESIGLGLAPSLLPGLTAAEQMQLEQFLAAKGAADLSLNSGAFRALGIETTVESGIGRGIFLRGGYTYLDAVVQRSFSNNQASSGVPVPIVDGVPVGAVSPLRGARPFRRPPHTGFFTASYEQNRLAASFTSAFAGRSDDSDFLAGADLRHGDSLLLPNRNLNFGYARLDLGASYRLLDWLGFYGQAENLLDSRHIAPIGYPSLPFSFRTGLSIQLGKSTAR